MFNVYIIYNSIIIVIVRYYTILIFVLSTYEFNTEGNL